MDKVRDTILRGNTTISNEPTFETRKTTFSANLPQTSEEPPESSQLPPVEIAVAELSEVPVAAPENNKDKTLANKTDDEDIPDIPEDMFDYNPLRAQRAPKKLKRLCHNSSNNRNATSRQLLHKRFP